MSTKMETIEPDTKNHEDATENATLADDDRSDGETTQSDGVSTPDEKTSGKKAAALKIAENPDDGPGRKTRTESSAGRIGRLAGDVGNRPISLRTLIIGTILLALIAATVTFAWLWMDRGAQIDDANKAQAAQAKAEQVALDYATGAADMNFQDPDGWRARLTKGTTPELATRLQKASSSMEQLIKPLQWSSTADPIAAKTESVKDGVYQVAAFVNVFTKNAQAPDGIESTATYKLTVDSNNGWVITDISGIGSNLNGGQPVQPN